MKTMGKRIHDKRKELCLTQEDLGKKLNPPVKRQAICKWENGETGEIKRSYIAQMAGLFNCDPVWLMGLENAPDVTLTYSSPGKENVVTSVNGDPIIGPSSLRARLYKVAVKVKDENLQTAIEILESLC